MRQAALLGIVTLCCLVVPLISLGGVGVVLGFLKNNPVIVVSGVVIILAGIGRYLRRRKS